MTTREKLITYELIGEEGPDHDKNLPWSDAADRRDRGRCQESGRTKKAAEQDGCLSHHSLQWKGKRTKHVP